MSMMTTPALVENTDSAPAMDPTRWGPMLALPCTLTLDLPVPRFTVAELLRLEPEAVIETCWPQGQDIPLRVNGELIAWAEFEVVDSRLALRITEWA